MLLGPGATSGAVSTLLPTAGLPAVNVPSPDVGQIAANIKTGLDSVGGAAQNLFSSWAKPMESQTSTPPGLLQASSGSRDVQAGETPASSGAQPTGSFGSSNLAPGETSPKSKKQRDIVFRHSGKSSILANTKFQINGKKAVLFVNFGQNWAHQMAKRNRSGENPDTVFQDIFNLAPIIEEKVDPTAITANDHLEYNNKIGAEPSNGMSQMAFLAANTRRVHIGNMLTNAITTDPTILAQQVKTIERYMQSKARLDPNFKPGDDHRKLILGHATGERENQRNNKKWYPQPERVDRLWENAQALIKVWDGADLSKPFKGQYNDLSADTKLQLNDTGTFETAGVSPQFSALFATMLYDVAATRTKLRKDRESLNKYLDMYGRDRDAVPHVSLTDTTVLSKGPNGETPDINAFWGDEKKMMSIYTGMWKKLNGKAIGVDIDPKADFTQYYTMNSHDEFAQIVKAAKADIASKRQDPFTARKIDEEFRNSVLVGDSDQIIEQIEDLVAYTDLDGISFRINSDMRSSIDALKPVFDYFRVGNR